MPPKITKQFFALLFAVVLINACTPPPTANNFITQEALVQRIQSNTAPLILDVRTAQEYAQGHIPSAINIEHTQLKEHLDRLTGHRHQEIVVHCESGLRAAVAEKILQQHGFKNILHLTGDMRAWRDKQLPLEFASKS